MDRHGFTTDVGNLHGFGTWFRGNEDLVELIGYYLRQETTSTAGLTGPALRPLTEALPRLADAVDTVFTALRGRVLDFGAAVRSLATEYAPDVAAEPGRFTDQTDIWPPRRTPVDGPADPFAGYRADSVARRRFWTRFVAGESLYADLCAPVAADFDRVLAIGRAWVSAASMLSELGVNMAVNTRRLVDGGGWTSAAAVDIQRAVDTHHLPTLTAVREICQLVGTGLLAVADAGTAAAAEIAALVPTITDRIDHLGAKSPDGTELQAILQLVDRARAAGAGVAAATTVAKSYVDIAIGLDGLVATLPPTLGVAVRNE